MLWPNTYICNICNGISAIHVGAAGICHNIAGGRGNTPNTSTYPCGTWWPATTATCSG